MFSGCLGQGEVLTVPNWPGSLSAASVTKADEDKGLVYVRKMGGKEHGEGNSPTEHPGTFGHLLC